MTFLVHVAIMVSSENVLYSFLVRKGCKPQKACDHREFQVPKMEVLNLIKLFWDWVFPYISLTYSLYR